MPRPMILILLLAVLLISPASALAAPEADNDGSANRTTSADVAAERGDRSAVDAARKSKANCKDKPTPAARKRCLKRLRNKPDPLPFFCNGVRATMLAQGSITVQGTNKRDVIVGDEARNFIFGRGGNDLICGNGGNDLIDGDDRFNPSPLTDGNDVIFGGFGEDDLIGGGGADTLDGGFGVDGLNGDEGDDQLFGGAGNDRGGSVNGTAGLRGGPGNDTLNGGDGDDDLLGGDGVDTLIGGQGIDRCAQDDIFAGDC